MDRDLQKQLQWLEDALFEEDDLVSDSQDFDLDDILGEYLEEEEPSAEDFSFEDFSFEEPRKMEQNRAVDFDRMAFGDEDFDESTAVLVTRKKDKQAKKAKPAKKQKSIRGLVILAIVEVVAILAVLLRWALWFL